MATAAARACHRDVLQAKPALGEARVVLDANAIRVATSQAQPFWPSREI
jgi:hypothetical protein